MNRVEQQKHRTHRVLFFEVFFFFLSFLMVVQCIRFHELSFIRPQEGAVGLGATLLALSRLQTKANKDGEMEKHSGKNVQYKVKEQTI